MADTRGAKQRLWEASAKDDAARKFISEWFTSHFDGVKQYTFTEADVAKAEKDIAPKPKAKAAPKGKK